MVTHEIKIESDDVIQAVKDWIDRNVTSVEEQDVSIDIRSYGGATIRLTPRTEEEAEANGGT